MELVNSYRDLTKEIFLFRSFKRMKVWQAVLGGIAVLPFIALFALFMVIYGAILMIHKLLDAPADYIYGFMKKEGKDVNPGAQAVIYLIGFPIVFLFKFATGMLLFVLFIVHLLTSVIGYFATLGGITFSPFILEIKDRFVKREDAPYKKNAAVTTCVIIGLVLFILTAAVAPIGMVINNVTYSGASQTGFNTFYNKVMDYHNSGMMDDAQYAEFVQDYNAGKITAQTYETYHQRYFNSVLGYEMQAYQTYLNTQFIVLLITAILAVVYTAYVIAVTFALFRTKKVLIQETAAEEIPATEVEALTE